VRTEAESLERRLGLTVEPLLAAGGLVVFGLVSHRGLPWAALGASAVLVAAAAIARSLRRAVRPAALLGLGRVTARTASWSIPGMLLGTGAAFLHRQGMGISIWPVAGAGAFALVACMIGATEEVVYRGWLQGTLRPFGWHAAVACSAVAHAAYKTALFAWLPGSEIMDLAAIALWTTVGGVVLGMLREISDSLLPAILAHVAFDFMVYGTLNHAPWWVWS